MQPVLSLFLLLGALGLPNPIDAFVGPPGVRPVRPTKLEAASESDRHDQTLWHRRRLLQTTVSGLLLSPVTANAALQERLDIDSFLRSGMDPSGAMGVSGQAGKSRPETGVVLRDGSEVSQDGAGNVLAEVLVGGQTDQQAVVATFAAPWPLARGSQFDVECRDAKSGDSVFLAVTRAAEGKSVDQLPWTFFTERLFSPTGRFAFYGPPTDIKLKSSESRGNYRFIEVSFSNLSQSTNAEIPREALLAATIVPGTDNAVCLVASANAGRWNKGSGAAARRIVESFRATAAPKSSLKVRAKDRRQGPGPDPSRM